MCSQIIPLDFEAEEFFYHILTLDNMEKYIKLGYELDEWPFLVWLDENSPVYFSVNWDTFEIKYRTPAEALERLWETI